MDTCPLHAGSLVPTVLARAGSPDASTTCRCPIRRGPDGFHMDGCPLANPGCDDCGETLRNGRTPEAFAQNVCELCMNQRRIANGGDEITCPHCAGPIPLELANGHRLCPACAWPLWDHAAKGEG